jgi:hypothetical protein
VESCWPHIDLLTSNRSADYVGYWRPRYHVLSVLISIPMHSIGVCNDHAAVMRMDVIAITQSLRLSDDVGGKTSG